jgi:hypothetical protein
MEKDEVYWLLGIVGSFCGIILAMVTWYAGKIHGSFTKLVDTTNTNTTVIAVESKRNDSQDNRLDRHDDDIDTLKERVYQVTYTKRAG